LPSIELDEAVERIRSTGAKAMALPGDVSDYAAVAESARTCLDQFGQVDVLVNNAGISQPKGLLEITEAEWDRTVAVNLKGCFNWCRNIAPAMVEAGRGRIVNISSVSATTGGARSAVSKFAYCSAKAGILGMTRALAKELAPHVAVSAICPGSIETNLTKRLIDANRQPIIETIPLGRIGTPEDVAVVVAFLATVEPNFITGEIIDVDGGQWIN
jgi:3-oxoacyl-[acyl-carrier protein] reductase